MMPVTAIRWSRPYEDQIRVAIGGLAVFGSCFFAFALTMMAVQWRQASVASVAGLTGFASLWLTFAWRWQRTALLVSESGVRVRWLLRTRTFTWSQIRGFETGRDLMVVARLWIILADGNRVRTPVQLVERRFSTTLRDGGTWLRSETYGQTLSILRRRLAAAHGEHPHTAVG